MPAAGSKQIPLGGNRVLSFEVLLKGMGELGCISFSRLFLAEMMYTLCRNRYLLRKSRCADGCLLPLSWRKQGI